MAEVVGLTRKFLTLEDSLFTRSLERRIHVCHRGAAALYAGRKEHSLTQHLSERRWGMRRRQSGGMRDPVAF